MSRRRLAAASVLLLLAGSPALANPVDVFGFGSRSAALGGAGVALCDGGCASYYNPAGLARAGALSLEIGYQGGQPLLTLNGRDQGVSPTHGLTAALAAPGTLFGLRVAFGAAVFLPDERLVRDRSLPFARPRFVDYDNRTQRIYLAAAVALALPGRVFLGGGVAFMARTAGTVELRGRLAVTNPDDDSLLVSAIAVDLLPVRYPQLGVAWEPTGWLTLGASYRGSFLLRIDQGFNILGDVGNRGTTPLVSGGALAARTVSADLFQPWQVSVGAAARLSRRWLVTADLVFARWSEFEAPVAAVTVKLDLGPRLNPLVQLAPPRRYPAPGFHDVLSPRLGVELLALLRPRAELVVRAGWSYQPSPVPEQVGESNYVDCDQHTASLGAGVTLMPRAPYLPRRIALDGHLATTVLLPRAAHKADPTDAVGDWVAAGTVIAGGLTMRIGF